MVDNQQELRKSTGWTKGERLLAWALAAGALMSGLNAFVQVTRLVIAAIRHVG